MICTSCVKAAAAAGLVSSSTDMSAAIGMVVITGLGGGTCCRRGACCELLDCCYAPQAQEGYCSGQHTACGGCGG
jgi:hypothetical protein